MALVCAGAAAAPTLPVPLHGAADDMEALWGRDEASTEHPAEAKALVRFMLSKEFQADVPLQMFVFPARSDVALPPVFAQFADVTRQPAQRRVRGDADAGEAVDSRQERRLLARAGRAGRARLPPRWAA